MLGSPTQCLKVGVSGSERRGAEDESVGEYVRNIRPTRMEGNDDVGIPCSCSGRVKCMSQLLREAGEKPDRDSLCLSDELYHIHILWVICGEFGEH